MTFSYRKAEQSELDLLRSLSIQTFQETYASFNTAENMQKYISEDLSEEQLLSELTSPDAHFYFILQQEVVVGYIKLIFHPHINILGKGIEIARIYILRQFQRTGAGKHLLKLAETLARSNDMTHIWLGVWENNLNAIRFYSRNDFSVSGEQFFKLGDDLQRDLVMIKTVI